VLVGVLADAKLTYVAVLSLANPDDLVSVITVMITVMITVVVTITVIIMITVVIMIAVLDP
jgi:hypothetical protein